MTAKIKYITSIIFILISIQVRSQEMLGLGFSNYSGISGKNINPAFLTGSKVYIDVNIVGAGLFFQNNYGYIPKENGNIWSIIRGDSLPAKYGPYQFNNFYTYIKNKPNYNFEAAVSIMGPGIMIQDGKQAFGVSLSFRSYASAYHFPGDPIQNIYNGSPAQGAISQTLSYENFGLTSLSWNELSFNYAYDFYERYGNKFTIGIEFKVLFGVEGLYSTVDKLKYHWTSDSKIYIDTLNASVGLALPIDNNNGNKINLNPWAKGHGIGFNIGFLYTKNKSNIYEKGGKELCSKPYEDYQYRIGLSILGVGGIHFNNNAQLYQFQVGNRAVDTKQIGVYSSVNLGMRSLSHLITGDSTKTFKGSAITMNLPSALNLQMDYHFQKNFYMSGFWIQPLRFQKKSLRRPAQLDIIPRYDTRLLGISFPVSWYNYQQIRMGFALRIYNVTLGTEKIGTLLGMGNLSGMDFYFNIKINLEKGSCASWKQGACPN